MASGMQLYLRDITYYLKVKRGLHPMASKGIVDIDIANDGLTFKVHAHRTQRTKQGLPSLTEREVQSIILAREGFSLKPDPRDGHEMTDCTRFTVVDNVDVAMDYFAIKTKKTGNRVLSRVAKPVLLELMKAAVTKAIEKRIMGMFEETDACLYSVCRET